MRTLAIFYFCLFSRVFSCYTFAITRILTVMLWFILCVLQPLLLAALSSVHFYLDGAYFLKTECTILYISGVVS
jgi:hypothetical protein